MAAVVIKNFILRDMTPCNPLKANTRFGGKFHLHLEGRISQEINHTKQVASRAYWRRQVLLKRRLTFNILYGVTSYTVRQNSSSQSIG
jgi:hypothetical protein